MRRAKKRKAEQQEIAFHVRGGRRPGSGREPKGAKALVAHARRGALTGREPVLVTLKMRPEVWNLRARARSRASCALSPRSGS